LISLYVIDKAVSEAVVSQSVFEEM